jgi:hypothetical protein
MANPSPFPGMDPFLEPHWQGIHGSLTVYARDQLQPQLPHDLRASSEERVLVNAYERSVSRSIHPHVYVVESSTPFVGGAGLETQGTAVCTEPLIVHVRNEPVRQRYIEIREAEGDGRVVTVIEFVSPSNKLLGEGRELYEQKQQECLQARVNLVEIDLTRKGRRKLLVSDRLPSASRETYVVCTRRADRPLQYEVYPISLRSELPTIRIPLRPRDADVSLALQPLVDAVYVNGRYHTIDYTQPLDPPLSDNDAAWLRERRRERQPV